MQFTGQLSVQFNTYAEKCWMVGGCVDTVGYIVVENRDGKATITPKNNIRTGGEVTLLDTLHLRRWPKINSGNLIKYGTRVKILELFLEDPQKKLAIVRLLTDGDADPAPKWTEGEEDSQY